MKKILRKYMNEIEYNKYNKNFIYNKIDFIKRFYIK